MHVRKIQSIFVWFVIVSELSHVFCCVLPSIFTIVSIIMTMGFISAMPVWMSNVHDVIHEWEIPVITVSGVILLISWALHFISKRIDCHDTGCMHEPCEPKKSKNLIVLKIATVLFVINISIYSAIHLSYQHSSQAHKQHGHEYNHDH